MADRAHYALSFLPHTHIARHFFLLFYTYINPSHRHISLAYRPSCIMSIFHSLLQISRSTTTTNDNNPYTMHTTNFENCTRDSHRMLQDAHTKDVSGGGIPSLYTSGVEPIPIQRHCTQGTLDDGLQIAQDDILDTEPSARAYVYPFYPWSTSEARTGKATTCFNVSSNHALTACFEEFLQSTLSSSIGSTFSTIPDAVISTPVSQQLQQQCVSPNIVDPIISYHQDECDLLFAEDLFEDMPVTGQSCDLEQFTPDAFNRGGASAPIVPSSANSTSGTSLPKATSGNNNNNAPNLLDYTLPGSDCYFGNNCTTTIPPGEDDPPNPPAAAVAQTVDLRVVTSPSTHPLASPADLEQGNQSCSSVLVHMMDTKLAITSPTQTSQELHQLAASPAERTISNVKQWSSLNDWLEQQQRLLAVQVNNTQHPVKPVIRERKSPRKAAAANRGRKSTADRTKRPQPVRRTIHYCPYCSHSSNRSNNMKGHILTHFPDRPRDFACETCFKEFTRKHDLKRHWKTHDKDNNKRDKKQ